jgi:hypothetical protein
MTDEPLGRRLRRERERRHISLESISAATKIGVPLLQALEAEDVGRLPAGIFRRSIVRSYACAVGVDPDETLSEFLACFPDPPELATELTASPDGGAASLLRRRNATGLRLTLADSGNAGERVLQNAAVRLTATACDLSVISALAVVAYVVLHQFWLPLAVVAMIYYPAGLVLLGNTPGMFIKSPKVRTGAPLAAPRPMDAPADRTVFDDVSLPISSFRTAMSGGGDLLEEGLRLPSPAARGSIMETFGNISGQH